MGAEAVTLPGPPVAMNVLGSAYELIPVKVGLDERVDCLELHVWNTDGPPSTSDGCLVLIPDEAEALAAALVRWARSPDRGKPS